MGLACWNLRENSSVRHHLAVLKVDRSKARLRTLLPRLDECSALTDDLERRLTHACTGYTSALLPHVLRVSGLVRKSLGRFYFQCLRA